MASAAVVTILFVVLDTTPPKPSPQPSFLLRLRLRAVVLLVLLSTKLLAVGTPSSCSPCSSSLLRFCRGAFFAVFIVFFYFSRVFRARCLAGCCCSSRQQEEKRQRFAVLVSSSPTVPRYSFLAAAAAAPLSVHSSFLPVFHPGQIIIGTSLAGSSSVCFRVMPCRG